MPSVERDRTDVARPGARLDDVTDLRDHEPQLVVCSEEVRADADPGTRTEVAEDRALLELCIDGGGLRHADDHCASAPNRIARGVHPEARCIGELDEPGRELVREFYLNNTEVAALAERLGRAPQTLYNKLNALRRLLADCMKRRLAQEA